MFGRDAVAITITDFKEKIMVMGVNRAVIVGTLEEDPKVRQTRDGNVIANISVITTDYWKDYDTGEDMQNLEQHRVVLSGRLADYASTYLRKGLRAYFEGNLRTHLVPDEQGWDRYTTEIIAHQVELAG
jgi:single-strand DNA-binding protein